MLKHLIYPSSKYPGSKSSGSTSRTVSFILSSNLKRFVPAVIRLSSVGMLMIWLLAGLACRSHSQPGELTMLIEKRITTFDPRVSSDSANERMRQLIFNGLTRKDNKFEPVPDLAESFESAPDYQTFTFRLRGGIKFHNGRALSSRDVKYTFETMMAKGFASDKKGDFTREDAAGLPLVAFIEAADPQTVIFRCNRPFPGLPNSIIPVGIIPEGTGEQQAKSP